MPQNSTILLKKSPENHQLDDGKGWCPMQRANWTTGKDGVPCSMPTGRWERTVSHAACHGDGWRRHTLKERICD
jgi:hypothetical protein